MPVATATPKAAVLALDPQLAKVVALLT